jgi:hypothetical protein
MLVSNPKGSPRPFEVCDSQATFSPQTLARRSAPLRSETIPVENHMALTSRWPFGAWGTVPRSTDDHGCGHRIAPTHRLWRSCTHLGESNRFSMA